MTWMELDLVLREAQWGEAGGRVRLVAQPIACLLERGAVVLQAVGLHNEA